MSLTALALVASLSLYAAPPSPAYQKVTDASKLAAPPGLSVETDQAYALSFAPLAGHVVALASAERGGDGRARPSLVLSKDGKIAKVIALPGLMEGWNLVQVEAFSFADVNRDGLTDVLVVATLEPLSGRSEDYWQQAFVFLADRAEKLVADATMNRALADAKPRPATIAAAKKVLTRFAKP